ncbi:hypothetical protein OEZ85_002498 [Tetradesmus obliquus]|uniref:Uncharacterized protein n=1 Tax=Tetradesmus obliquus TaxID=3088 RepID=A0ABY8TZX9_TETOB|nr:hypothetical protein OEZ85_002498 [Tetradesmus obliquus]
MRLGTLEPLDQAGFVSVLRGVPACDQPGKYLSFRYPVRPKAAKSQKKSERLNANDIQEEVMYALVGCTDIGWSSRNVNQTTREFLLEHYGIDKATISTFFKNRSQRTPYSNPPASASLPGHRSSRSSSSSGATSSGCGGTRSSRRFTSHAAAAAAAAADASVAVGPRSGLVLPPPLQVPSSMLAPPPVSAAAAGGSGSSGASSFSASLAARMGLGPVACSSSGGISAEMSTAAAAAAMASTAMPEAIAYGGLDIPGMAGFGLCSPPSLPGLSAAMSLPVSLDSEGYLRSISGDLDAAADMTLVGGAGCISPCGFSA